MDLARIEQEGGRGNTEANWAPIVYVEIDVLLRYMLSLLNCTNEIRGVEVKHIIRGYV